MDYDRLIDAETRAFVARVEAFAPAGAPPVAARRRAYDAMCRAFDHGRPAGVTAADGDADGVSVRVYSAGDPTRSVVYLHGGGFVFGGLESHDDICAEICAGTGYRVVAVDYRLAPEHVHPAAFDDAWTAVCWVARTWDDGLVLAGDSAGGTLAALVAHHARGRLDAILGQVLIYPALGGDPDRGSYLNHAEAPLLTRADMLAFRALYAGGAVPVADPRFDPLADDDFAGLPPTVIFTADCDPLRDDGRDYRDRLERAEVPVAWINEEGMVHGHLRARHSVARAGDCFERIELAIEALGQGLWPYD